MLEYDRVDCSERLAVAGISAAELALGRYELLPVSVAEQQGIAPGPLAALLWRDLDTTTKAVADSAVGIARLPTSGAPGRKIIEDARSRSNFELHAAQVPQPLRSSVFHLTESVYTGGGAPLVRFAR